MLQSEELLQLLRTSERFLSGEKLSRKLGVTRAAIWKKIEQLRAEGYEIGSVTRKGYRLRKTPGRFQLKPKFGPTLPPARLALPSQHCKPWIPQTMRQDGWLKKVHRMAVLSCQKNRPAGKGRLGRQWVSPPGSGIWFSVLLRPHALPGGGHRSHLAFCRCRLPGYPQGNGSGSKNQVAK